MANHSAHDLAEVWHAGIGGITGLGNREDTKIIIPELGTATHSDLFKYFPEFHPHSAGRIQMSLCPSVDEQTAVVAKYSGIGTSTCINLGF